MLQGQNFHLITNRAGRFPGRSSAFFPVVQRGEVGISCGAILRRSEANTMSEKVPYLDLPAQIRSLRAELDAAIARTLVSERLAA